MLRREWIPRWSERLGRNMRLVVWGHYGRPVLGFPSGDQPEEEEWEYEKYHAIDALSDALDRGDLKLYTVMSADRNGLLNACLSPTERALSQRLYDEYIRWEVIPFIHEHCTKDPRITTIGPAMGAYHALNTLLKHPDVVRACCALSGTFDQRIHMGNEYPNDFYFNNPPDYFPNIDQDEILRDLHRSRVRFVTSTNEDAKPSYAMNKLLVMKGIDSLVDNWGLAGGKQWGYWAAQMRKFLIEEPI
jgi:esterase/lipase superfamily enzyme